MHKSMRGAVALLALITLAACGAGPGSTAKKFVEALEDKEFTKAKEVMTPQGAQLLDLAVSMGAAKLSERTKDGPYTVVSEKIEGELATVVLKDKAGKESTFNLQKIDGKWKVAMKK